MSPPRDFSMTACETSSASNDLDLLAPICCSIRAQAHSRTCVHSRTLSHAYSLVGINLLPAAAQCRKVASLSSRRPRRRATIFCGTTSRRKTRLLEQEPLHLMRLPERMKEVSVCGSGSEGRVTGSRSQGRVTGSGSDGRVRGSGSQERVTGKGPYCNTVIIRWLGESLNARAGCALLGSWLARAYSHRRGIGGVSRPSAPRGDRDRDSSPYVNMISEAGNIIRG